jgi:opine dehydrogenase
VNFIIFNSEKKTMNKLPITILGAGNVGCAMAAHATLEGYPVTLWAHPDHAQNLHVIQTNRGLTLDQETEAQFVSLNRVTTDLAEAIRGAHYIFIATPSHAQESLFKTMLPHVLPNQRIVTLSGNFSTQLFLKIKKQFPHNPDIALFETSISPYVARFAPQQGQSTLLGFKKWLHIVHAQPVSLTEKNDLSELLPCELHWSSDLYEAGLQNINGVVHPAATLLNVARIEDTQGDFYFFKQGITLTVAKLITAVDQERIDIANSLGIPALSLLKVMERFYGQHFSDVYQWAKGSIVHNKEKITPSHIQHRYLNEDIPYLLVPWYSLAQHQGIATPALKSLIDLASVLHGTCYLTNGRTLLNE